MPFARLASTIRLTTATVLFATLTIACWGQEPPSAPTPQNTPEARALPLLNYSKPATHFPNPIGPYTARHLAAPNLANTARIDSMMRDGKLYLSLNDAIALALENNLDIAISRFNLNIADTDILRARAGAAILGTPLGVVLNTASAVSEHNLAPPPAGQRWVRAASERAPMDWSALRWALGRTSPALIRSLRVRCRKITSARNQPAPSAVFPSWRRTLGR
jgi:hypothetical protein